MAARSGPSPGSARIAELKRAEADIHRELERLQAEEHTRQAAPARPPDPQKTIAATEGDQSGDQAGEGREMPSPEVVLDLVWKLPLPAAGRQPPSRSRGGEAYESRVFRAGSAAEKLARLEVRILGEQAAALGSLEAEARYRAAVAHVAWLEKAACVVAVGDELDAHEKAAALAKDATLRKQRAFRAARKRFEEEMAAAFRERDAIIQQAKEKVRKWKLAAASGAPRRPEPQRPAKTVTELRWKGARAEGQRETKEEEPLWKEEETRGRREEGIRGGAKEEKREEEKTNKEEREGDAKEAGLHALPCDVPPPFDEPTEGETFEDARGPESGSFSPEQPPGVLAAVAGATAAAAAAVYEVTVDTVAAPVRVVEELVERPAAVVQQVVTAPVAAVDALLVEPLLGPQEGARESAPGEQQEGRGGVQERVHEYEQRTNDRAATGGGRPAAGRPRSPGRQSGESSPEAWEVIEKNGAGEKGAAGEGEQAGEGPPSRGRQRRSEEGTAQERSQGAKPFAWGRKEEEAEVSEQRTRDEDKPSEQRFPVPAVP